MKALFLGLLLLGGARLLPAETALSPEFFPAPVDRLQKQIAVWQTTATGSTGIRYNREKAIYMTAVQTFVWKEPEALAGIALQPAPNANNLKAGSMNYALRLIEVPGAGPATSALGVYAFTLTGDWREKTDYIYLKLPEPVILTPGKRYAFQIAPRSKNSSRLTLATSHQGENSYSDGSGRMTSLPEIDSPLPFPAEASSWSFAFFLIKATQP